LLSQSCCRMGSCTSSVRINPSPTCTGGTSPFACCEALWLSPSPPPLGLWLLVLCPRRQQEGLLCALGLLPPGIAFLAQVLYLVFSISQQRHQQVALTFPGRFFLGVQSFSYSVFSASLRTNRRDSVQLGWINPERAVGLTFRSNLPVRINLERYDLLICAC